MMKMFLQKVHKKQKNLGKKKIIFWDVLKVSGEIAGSGYEFGSISQRYGSADPDPYQNFMDPQHCGSVNGLALLVRIRTAFPLQIRSVYVCGSFLPFWILIRIQVPH
jgi:hypothetical protein